MICVHRRRCICLCICECVYVCVCLLSANSERQKKNQLKFFKVSQWKNQLRNHYFGLFYLKHFFLFHIQYRWQYCILFLSVSLKAEKKPIDKIEKQRERERRRKKKYDFFFRSRHNKLKVNNVVSGHYYFCTNVK